MKRTVFFSGIFAVTALLGPSLGFECSIFPGEGPHRIQASGDEIVLRTAPTAQASVADTISPVRGEIIMHSDVRFRTIMPGLFLAREDGAIHGTSYGRVFYLSRTDYYRGRSGYDTFSFSKGDTIEYLQYRAEGSTFLRIDGVVVCADLLSERAVPLRRLHSFTSCSFVNRKHLPMISKYIDKLREGESLQADEAEQCLSAIL